MEPKTLGKKIRGNIVGILVIVVNPRSPFPRYKYRLPPIVISSSLNNIKLLP